MQTGTNERTGLPVALVIGGGGMGMSTARRLGQSHRVVLASQSARKNTEREAALSTVVWGNDYPHAEGTFNGTDEVIAEHFDSTVSDEDRAAILGGTLAKVAGFDTSKKLAVERHPADSAAS